MTELMIGAAVFLAFVLYLLFSTFRLKICEHKNRIRKMVNFTINDNNYVAEYELVCKGCGDFLTAKVLFDRKMSHTEAFNKASAEVSKKEK